jgi:hypothetical protein
MIKSVTTYIKSGTASWDYFMNPESVPAEHEVCYLWKTVYSNIYGTDSQSFFPGLDFTFTVVSPTELQVQLEADDNEIDTVNAWINHVQSLDVSHATDFYNLLELLYNGETFTTTLQIVEVPDSFNGSDIQKTYNDLKNGKIDEKITIVE